MRYGGFLIVGVISVGDKSVADIADAQVNVDFRQTLATGDIDVFSGNVFGAQCLADPCAVCLGCGEDFFKTHDLGCLSVAAQRTAQREDCSQQSSREQSVIVHIRN